MYLLYIKYFGNEIVMMCVRNRFVSKSGVVSLSLK